MEIEINQAQSGMILARDVANSAGMILAPAGLTLTASFIDKLRERGIVHLDVQGEAKAESAQAQRIAYLFRRSQGDPIRTVLRQAVEKLRGIEVNS